MFCNFTIAQSQTCLYGNCNTGFGDYIFENGDEYIGEWVNGERTGLGAYYWSWGAAYYGYFRNGALEGKGYYFDSLKTGKNDLSGYFESGKLITAQSIITNGCVLGNCTNGVGHYIWEGTGDAYMGEWVNSNRTGFGVYEWKDGPTYVGEFLNGKLDGFGDYIPKTGEIQSGWWIDGEFYGEVPGE